MMQQLPDELAILLAPRDELCYGEIMNFQTQAAPISRVFVPHRNQSVFPIPGKHRRFFCDTVGVVAKRLMKWRTFAD
ncbi:MAG TPA: hypothetical protein VFW05_11755 [Verrucomicrobiae bacterium]|jgi:hypothetical protein|nr:hypothetical protein [Verrucomicrobiae bacterium]